MWTKKIINQMSNHYEIFDPTDDEVIGTAIELEDGSLSITINGSFVGIYHNFDSWNIGKSYQIRQVIEYLKDYDPFEGLLDAEVQDAISGRSHNPDDLTLDDIQWVSTDLEPYNLTDEDEDK